MGLFKCPDCESNISDRGSFCPHCGCPVNKGTIAESKDKEKRKLEQEKKLMERKLVKERKMLELKLAKEKEEMEAKLLKEKEELERRKYNEKLLNEINKLLVNKVDAIRKKLVKSGRYISIPSDYKKYKTIGKILNKNKNYKPLLSCFTPVIDGVLFTDSYHLFVLNNDYLPFNVAFNKDYPLSRREKYIKEYNLQSIDGEYPLTMSVVPKCRCLDCVYININDFLLEYYTRKNALKDKECKELFKIQKDNNVFTFDMVMTLETKIGKIGYDAEFIKNAIDILKLDSDFYIYVYGENKPMMIKNKDEEMALIMPIRLSS